MVGFDAPFSSCVPWSPSPILRVFFSRTRPLGNFPMGVPSSLVVPLPPSGVEIRSSRLRPLTLVFLQGLRLSPPEDFLPRSGGRQCVVPILPLWSFMPSISLFSRLLPLSDGFHYFFLVCLTFSALTSLISILLWLWNLENLPVSPFSLHLA